VGSKKVGSELVQVQPKAFADGTVQFDFFVVAPLDAGTFSLFASGLSANGDGLESGDGSAVTTLDITVPEAAPEHLPEGAEAGCSAAGGAPLLALAALVLGRLRRRPATR
jgi:uncharacterized protein (TIGR03382 family)